MANNEIGYGPSNEATIPVDPVEYMAPAIGEISAHAATLGMNGETPDQSGDVSQGYREGQ